ncbi:MAG TPA: Hsp70 family protein [Polyangiaceae bacterium]|nr:Hsp70 family protein [Polyangiaceae bacterium]
MPIHVLQGERQMAADNRSLTRFELTGIPPAPRQVPKIQVTFKIDANGVVSIEAKDLGTGRAQTIRVTAGSGLSQEDVERLVNEGERFRQADDMRRELAELKNQAETLLYTTGAALEGYADLVDGEVLDAARQQAARLRELLDSASDIALIREAHQGLEAMVFAIAEKMYGAAGDEADPADGGEPQG